MRKLLVIMLFAIPLAAACNTVEGFGKDVDKAGDHISDRAEQAKH